MHLVTFTIPGAHDVVTLAPVAAQYIRRVYTDELALSITDNDSSVHVECMVTLKKPVNEGVVSQLDVQNAQKIVSMLGQVFNVEAVEVFVNPAPLEKEVDWAMHVKKNHLKEGGLLH